MKNHSGTIYRISRTFFILLIKLVSRTRIYGTENIPEPPYIIASNHASMIDPPLISYAFISHDIDYVAKNKLFTMPVIGRWTRMVNCIPVDRNGGNVFCLREALRRIRNGRVVCIFPEGGRTIDGKMSEAEQGVGFLVHKARVPVVPVYIRGSFETLPKHKKIPSFRSNIEIMIGHVIRPKEYADEGETGKRKYDYTVNKIMDRIQELQFQNNGMVLNNNRSFAEYEKRLGQ
jgi:1-acyl-sn-glycerol-3-phosphate acyltransferase